MNIGHIDLSQKVFVIAEAGGNHDGSLDEALKLVKAASETGADAVKFQTYRAELLVHPEWKPMPNVKHKFKTQHERFRDLEFSTQQWREIIDFCAEVGIFFMTTPFYEEVLDLFIDHMPAVKIASGDLTHYNLIERAVNSEKPVILSTGMATFDEIEAALSILDVAEVALLHCVSVYPTPDNHVNLMRIQEIKARWPSATIGYSDHSIGTAACVGAVALGARIIEKHFTIDKQRPIGDHLLSANPQEMRGLVDAIRSLEKMLDLGEAKSSESDMKQHLRRGVYAKRQMTVGEVIRMEDLLIIRPEAWFAASEVIKLIGKKVCKPIGDLEAITPQNCNLN